MIRISARIAILFLIISTQLLSMDNSLFTFLGQLKNSLLLKKCVLCKKSLFIKNIVEKECLFLENKLEAVDKTGGNRSSSGNNYWSGVANFIEALAQQEAGKRNRKAIDTILVDEPIEVRDQEEAKLNELAYQLAENYDKRKAAKKVWELNIWNQLTIEQQQREASKDESIIVKDIHEHYPLIQGMLDSSKLKPVCLPLKKARFMRSSLEKCCDSIEEDFKKIAKTGCIEFGFLHSTTFKEKKDQHKYALNIILPYESEESKEEELVKLEFYAAQLEKKYRQDLSISKIIDIQQFNEKNKS